jgi:hypothetical protein
MANSVKKSSLVTRVFFFQGRDISGVRKHDLRPEMTWSVTFFQKISDHFLAKQFEASGTSLGLWTRKWNIKWGMGHLGSNLYSSFRKYRCPPFQNKCLIQEITMKLRSKCMWNFRTWTLGAAKLFHLTYSPMKDYLNAFRMFLSTTLTLACF